MKKRILGGVLWGLAVIARASGDSPLTLQGDVGMALYRTPAITRTDDKQNVVLPYVYADYGSAYARVDTFGIKMMPLGAGHLELAGRVSFEGYQSTLANIGTRSTPRPLGLGTYQETAYGAFFLYSFYDIISQGTLLDGTYAAEFDVGPVHVYPQIGLERRSAKYVQHLYGVSAAEAASSGLRAYAPNASTTPSLALAFEYPLSDNLNVMLQFKKKWLDKSLTDSPLVDTKSQTSSFLAVTRSFK